MILLRVGLDGSDVVALTASFSIESRHPGKLKTGRQESEVVVVNGQVQQISCAKTPPLGRHLQPPVNLILSFTRLRICRFLPRSVILGTDMPLRLSKLFVALPPGT